FIPHESVGVIVPYRLQIVQVMQEIASLGIPERNGITVDTVERYQGSQRDVIIYGFTVRQPYQLQFLCSQSFVEQGAVIDRKLNVALTRAREQLVLIGNPTILSLDEVHRRLVEEIGTTTFPE
ncbi:MAG: DNA helicase, partial [Bacteroidaceae bacterium]|nr:DNA helicase [Bacteroidaceae bacterium]